MNIIDILAALVIDWIIGDPYWFPHPVIYIGKLIRFLENRGRKLCKTKKALKLYGGFIVVAVSAVSFLIPFMILSLLKPYKLIYHVVNIFILWTTIAARCLHKEGKKVYDSLEKEDIEDARVKLSYIVGRETSNLSEKEIIRADVETIAENTCDGVIAPLFYAMIGGTTFASAFAMMYKSINTMDSMLGYMNEKYIDIGFFPANTDDVFNYIPARLTGILMCLSSFIVKGSMINSFNIMIRDRKNHKSPNCAYPEAATAGALNVQLGGNNTYFGQVVEKPTLGDRKVELNSYHIVGAIKLMYSSEVIFVILYSLIYMVVY